MTGKVAVVVAFLQASLSVFVGMETEIAISPVSAVGIETETRKGCMISSGDACFVRDGPHRHLDESETSRAYPCPCLSLYRLGVGGDGDGDDAFFAWARVQALDLLGPPPSIVTSA